MGQGDHSVEINLLAGPLLLHKAGDDLAKSIVGKSFLKFTSAITDFSS
jgi:hypothetical protein